MVSTEDFDIFKSLWQNVNDVCAPPPPPGQPAKACFLMEMPGFSVDSDAFDPSKFDPKTMVSPDMSVATLCDRVPAIARYFYDTGNHISFFWSQLMKTCILKPVEENGQDTTKQKYEEALQMLYGGKEGYENYENNAGPYNEKVDAAYWEYNNLKMQVERYEAAIFRYATGDLSTVLLEQASGKMIKCGNNIVN